MCPPVLRVSLFRLCRIEGIRLAVADRPDSFRSDTQVNQVSSDRIGSSFPQSEIVFFRTHFIAVTFDQDIISPVILEPLRIAVEGVPVFGTDGYLSKSK